MTRSTQPRSTNGKSAASGIMGSATCKAVRFGGASVRVHGEFYVRGLSIKSVCYGGGLECKRIALGKVAKVVRLEVSQLVNAGLIHWCWESFPETSFPSLEPERPPTDRNKLLSLSPDELFISISLDSRLSGGR